ncbi:hypothetical protein OUZ56_016667 [Daphnia magna]|uniref:Alpha 1,4-glycosyltransferase domain-containing protein n=1 Tax=Daphnia magna TaxID=35525 RepID=A0ABR0ARA8_9CRUS|nr:hypothetical protein OUZ56_016667 [Daphnia magna]
MAFPWHIAATYLSNNNVIILTSRVNRCESETQCLNVVSFIGSSRLLPGADNLCPIESSATRWKRNEKAQNIFFLETSGERCLTARQACSIESTARSNPYAMISVHMENSGPTRQANVRNEQSSQRRNCAITNRLFEEWENNVKLVREDLLQHLRDTPLWRLQQQGRLNQSVHPLTHRSDAVRVAMLWKYGGVYLDLDCLVFRPLYCLKNTVGLVDFLPDWVENGVMAFEGGHPFLQFLMKYMVFAFKPEEYISLGPATLTDSIKYFCDRTEFPAEKILTCRNSSIILQSPRAFYAINNRRQNAFYHPEADQSDFEDLRFSYLSHVYDAGNRPSVPDKSLYGLLAREFCPTTYSMALADGEF